MLKIINKDFHSSRAYYFSENNYVQFPDKYFAYSYLSHYLYDSFAMMKIRDLLADQMFDVNRMSEHEILKTMSWCLVSGRFKMVDAGTEYDCITDGTDNLARPLSTGDITGIADIASSSAIERTLSAKPLKANTEVKQWIEIQLLGEDDKPIRGEKYRIELPNGKVKEGILDYEGIARMEGIEPGQCVVTFPEIDQDAWDSI